MNFKIYSAKHTPNLMIVSGGNGSLLFGYTEKASNLSDEIETYQCMKQTARNIVNSMPPNAFEPDKDYTTHVIFGFIRARQVLEISMPFIYRNGSIISDPHGAMFLGRKINAVYN